MPLSDEEADRLCRGRVIYTSVRSSSGAYDAGPHYAIVLNSDEQIKKTGMVRVVVASTTDTMPTTYAVEAPRKAGLKGKVYCDWVTEVHERHVKRVPNRPPLTNADLLPFLEMIQKAIADGVLK